MASPARRRWYQFRLRTLLLGVTLAALVALAYRTCVEPYAQQRRAMEVIRELGGAYRTSGPTLWQRQLFGADHQNLQSVSLADCDDPDRYVSYIARLPAIQTLVVGGEQFTDAHLRRLSRLSTLRTLILDSTEVSEAGLAAWQQRLPHVKVYRSQRRTIRTLQSAGWLLTTAKTSPISSGIEAESQRAVEDLAGPGFFAEVHTAVSCHIDDAGLRPLRYLPALRTLSLADAGITDAGLQSLGTLTYLDYLDLTGTLVTDAGLPELAAFASLAYLDLAATAVTDDGLAQLAALKKLRWLNLNRTSVSYAGIQEHVAPLTNLRMLCVEDTPISAQEAAALNEIMDPCAVIGPGGKLKAAHWR